MTPAGIDKVTRLVALFTLLLVGLLVGGGWAGYLLLGGVARDAALGSLREEGQMLRSLLEPRPGGPGVAWEDLDAEALRLAAGLDRLELLDAQGFAAAEGSWRLPPPELPEPLRTELALGLDVAPPPVDEDGELYQSLFLPLADESGAIVAVLLLESGDEASRRLADLRRGLWAATGLGALFVVFVIGAMIAVLGQARRRQRELDRAEHLARVGTLAAGLAHEIRNPLAIIAGNAELLELEAEGKEERRRAEEMLEEVERLQHLLDDFLHFARPQGMEPERVDAAAFWAGIVGEQRALHPETEFAFDAAEDLPALLADTARLRQVALNLLANAVAASGAGGRVELGLDLAAGALRLRVRDDGPGVPPHLREDLFQPFVSGREGGTGLGLALSRSLARAHGGDLALTRPGPGGTEFTLTLPAAGGKGKVA